MISITNLIQKIKTSRKEEKYRAEGPTLTDWFQDMELDDPLTQDPEPFASQPDNAPTGRNATSAPGHQPGKTTTARETTAKDAQPPGPKRTKPGQLSKREVELFHKKCLNQFVRGTKLNPADWEKYRDKIFIISGLVPASELSAHISPYIPLSEKQQANLDKFAAKYQGSSTQLFARVNEKLPKEKQALKVGKLARPVAADIYIVGHQRKDKPGKR